MEDKIQTENNLLWTDDELGCFPEYKKLQPLKVFKELLEKKLWVLRGKSGNNVEDKSNVGKNKTDQETFMWKYSFWQN